jgi:hypothetical protein
VVVEFGFAVQGLEEVADVRVTELYVREAAVFS